MIFKVIERKGDDFSWQLVDETGKVLARSAESYRLKSDAIDTIWKIRGAMHDDCVPRICEIKDEFHSKQ
jgi:uncharacterized protein YegP (UPF0339 family)